MESEVASVQITSRNEYPRPRLVRDRWLGLNGNWRFAFDDGDQGLREGWHANPEALDMTINVPYSYQTPASGINVQEHHSIVWYARDFDIPADWLQDRILLNFGAVDYEATVWVNGRVAGTHRGGYVPFSLDIAGLVQEGANQLVVRVVDEPRIDQPRGKQTARKGPWACWYTPVTGIWQSVWLEPVHQAHITDLHLVPDIDSQSLKVEYELSRVDEGMSMELVASFGDEEVATVNVPIPPRFHGWSDVTPIDIGELQIPIPSPKLWSPEHPHLYDLVVRLRKDGQIVDEVRSYFGMRKVEIVGSEFYLNNRRYYQRLVLDQGYWQEGLYTAPSIEAIRQDVELTKAMGFNGARKHQKIEDPYYYYYCDQLGLLVWSEMPAAYEYSERAAQQVTAEWQKAVLRDRSHPSIVAWVPVNESWGVDQLKYKANPRAEAHLMALYYATHALDGTRPVISNDGWQHALTDLITIHEYTQDWQDLKARQDAFFADRLATTFSHGQPTLLPGYDSLDAPVLVTEFGGVKVDEQQAEGWGYGKAATSYTEMAERIRDLVKAITDNPAIQGFCYTQLTDVQQEVNGLLTIDRQPKVDVELLKEIFRQGR